MSGDPVRRFGNYRATHFNRNRGPKQIATTSHGNAPGAGHLQDSEGPQNLEQTVNFVHRTGHFENERFRRHVHHARPKYLNQFHEMRAIFLIGQDLNERQIAVQN